MRTTKHLACLAAFVGLIWSGTAHAADVTLKALFMSQAAYSDDDVRNMTSDFEKTHPGIKVDLEFVSYPALHDKIVASEGSSGSGYDSVLFDDIWPAEFSQNGFLTDVTSLIPASADQTVFTGAWSTVSYGGKRYGMPWILDTMYLFYNKAMLAKVGVNAPPKTWDELAQDAKLLKAKHIVQYPIVWSWAESEALICNWATLVAAYGGNFYQDGKPVFDQDGGLEALQYMVQTMKDGTSNPKSLQFVEDDVRRVIDNGDAAFALNWTYNYASANDPKQSRVAGQIGVEPAPGVAGKSSFAAINGSMGLGIPTNAAHPKEAWTYIMYMTSQPVQNKYAQLSLPIWRSSYDDPAVTTGQQSLIDAAKNAINVQTARPQLADYQHLSAIMQKSIQEALLGTATPEAALQEAVRKSRHLH
jgi:multiple sugar transport system substrate-binding protein